MQLVVKFRDGAVDPGDAAVLRKLTAVGQVAGTEFVRQMSGGAYVLRIACPASCDGAIERLRDSAIFEYIDRDSIQYHQ